MTPWATPAEAAQHWKDSTKLDPVALARLLNAATTQCVRFAPKLAADDPIPDEYKLACVLQARDIHAAYARTGDSEVVGDAAYPIRVRPLTDTVKQLLRPQSGVPAIGLGVGTAGTSSPTILYGGAP